MSKKQGVVSMAQAAAQRTNAPIERLAAETNKTYGAGTVVRASEMLAPPPRLSTGSLWFDLALGGGWPSNGWSEIVALESAGKTAVALKTIAHNQARDPAFTALWCAAEQFDGTYAKAIGVDLERLWVLEENTMEIVYNEVTKYVSERSVDMAVIDAYPSLVTNVEDQGAIGDAHISPGAKLTNAFMRQATKATKRSLIDPTDRPFTGLFINQWRDRIVMMGDPRTTPGGKGKNFWMNARVELAREDFLFDSEKFAIGQRILMKVFKLKGAPPKRTGAADFYFDDGDGHHFGEFDHAHEVFRLGMSEEIAVIERRGNDWYWKGTKVAKSQSALLDLLRSEPALVDEIDAAIRAKELGGSPAPETEAVAPVRTLPRRPRRSAA